MHRNTWQAVMLALAAFWGGALEARADWYGSHWRFRHRLTIDHTQVSATLTNFPVLVTEANVAAGLWASAQTNGADILFTADDGTTKLSHEIEAYDAGAQRLSVWVKVPALSSVTNTDLFVYYGYPAAASQENATGVWTGYDGVWHLKESAAGTNNSAVYRDSTANAYHGDDFVLATGKVGRIDGGQRFSGTNDFITLADFSWTTNQSYTISVWLKADTVKDQGAFGKASPYWEWGLRFSASGTQARYEHFNSSGSESLQLVATVNDQASWFALAVVYDGPNTIGRMYVNGVQVATDDIVVGQFMNRLTKATIGKCYPNAASYSGHIDEFRIESVARSAPWLQACYINQVAPAGFAAAGAEEMLPAGTVIMLQ